MNLWSTVGWCWEYTLKSWKNVRHPRPSHEIWWADFWGSHHFKEPKPARPINFKNDLQVNFGTLSRLLDSTPSWTTLPPITVEGTYYYNGEAPLQSQTGILHTHTYIYIYILLQTITTYTKHRSRYQGKLLAVLERLRLDLPCRQSLGFRPPACSPWAIPINPLAIIWSMAMTQEPIDWRYLRYIRPI